MTDGRPRGSHEQPWDRAASADPGDWPVGRLLSAAARRIEREWNTHLATWDLNHASLPVLLHLLAHPRSQRELAHVCGVTEQTMSRILARMERTGYITRAPDRVDRRRSVITITDTGRSVATFAADPRPAEAMTTRGLTPGQADQLRGLLAIVVRAHENHPEPDTDAPAKEARPAEAPGSAS
jgi:DNA-binding MarR family transcriptional regulator